MKKAYILLLLFILSGFIVSCSNRGHKAADTAITGTEADTNTADITKEPQITGESGNAPLPEASQGDGITQNEVNKDSTKNEIPTAKPSAAPNPEAPSQEDDAPNEETEHEGNPDASSQQEEVPSADSSADEDNTDYEETAASNVLPTFDGREYDIFVDADKPVNPVEADEEPGEEPSVTGAPANTLPIYMESSLSIDSPPADQSDLNNYNEDHLRVFDYTYDLINGCWELTKTPQKGFYLYSLNDEGNNRDYNSSSPKMRRCYLDNGSFREEFLDTEDCFYAPYEDKDGNIYAECGKQPYWERVSNKDLYIKKLDPSGKTLSKVCVGDFECEGLSYRGFAFIKEDTIALLFKTPDDNETPITQLQIVDIRRNHILVKINLHDNILINMKSDGNYFAAVSNSYQRVYVFDAETYQLVNTIDTTICKELGTYELYPYAFDDEEIRYDRRSYEFDLRDGKVYFLRHSGIFVTDCLESEFYMLLDGSQYKDFVNQTYVYSSFYVDENEDFYILGVFFDEESATDLWHYTKAD